MRLIIFLTTITFFTLQLVTAQPYSSCESTIEPIAFPAEAPTDGTNFYACTSGAVDRAYRQKTWPIGNQADNLYVIEYSNFRPLDANISGAWDTAFKGLAAGDTVFIRALTFDIDSVNGLVNEAQLLCPLLDALYGYMPCVGINGIINGENDGVPGVQTLEEVMEIAELVTNQKIRDFDTTIQALKKFNNFIRPLNAQVCFTYSDPPLMVFIEEDGPLCLQGDLDDDLIPNILEDVNGNGNVKDDDTDGDGLPNYLDNDDNGDGILTADYDVNGNGDPTDDDVNSDGIPDYIFTTMVNIEEVVEINQIYPNPNNGVFVLESLILNNSIKLELYNTAGQQVEFDIENNQFKIINPIKGIYFLKIDRQTLKILVN